MGVLRATHSMDNLQPLWLPGFESVLNKMLKLPPHSECPLCHLKFVRIRSHAYACVKELETLVKNEMAEEEQSKLFEAARFRMLNR